MDFRDILNKLPKEESKNANTYSGSLQQLVESSGNAYKKVVFEGYTDNEIRDLCHSKDHDCATTVVHSVYGKGKPVYESHAIPDDSGNVAWYDVQFKHGIEKKVPASDMEILVTESHGAKKKAKKEDVKSKDKAVKEGGGRDMDCSHCDGTGKHGDKDCKKCAGTGEAQADNDPMNNESKFRSKFDDMVAEAGKPDFLDVDKDGDKKEPMKKAAKDAKKAPMKKDAKKDAPKGKKEMSDKQKKFFGKKNESIKTAKKTLAGQVNEAKSPPEVINPTKDSSPADLKAAIKYAQYMKAKMDKPVAKKRYDDEIAQLRGWMKAKSVMKETVAESVEVIKDPSNLTYKEMIKLVQESGGQQQIDPVDAVLWTWAQRVAASKVEESNKAEIFAGLIYERNGGTFKMFDVLAEDK